MIKDKCLRINSFEWAHYVEVIYFDGNDKVIGHREYRGITHASSLRVVRLIERNRPNVYYNGDTGTLWVDIYK